MELKLIKEIKVKSNKTVTRLLLNPFKANQLISLKLDCSLSLLSLPNLQRIREVSLPGYAMSIIAFNKGFLIGLYNGGLLTLSQDFKILSSKKLHEDCLSQILIYKNNIITVGYDGIVNILDSSSMLVQNFLRFDFPIMQAKIYQDKLYLAGLKSYQVNLNDHSSKELKRFENFQIFKGRFYGCSDENGLTCITKNSNSYIPCQYLIAYRGFLLAFSDECISIINHQLQMEWRCHKFTELGAGYTIKSAVVTKYGLYLAGDQGKIIHFKQTEQNQQLNLRRSEKEQYEETNQIKISQKLQRQLLCYEN